MNEAQWLACSEPGPMLHFLTHERHEALGEAVGDRPRERALVSDRKPWLLVAAVERRWWEDSAGPETLKDLNRLEAVADGRLSRNRASFSALSFLVPRNAVDAALECVRIHDSPDDQAKWAAVLREIVNPFGPTPFQWLVANRPRREAEREWRRWRSPDVRRLAQAAYDGRDFGLLPVVADALLDAGCDYGPLLRHLRRPADCRACQNTGIGADEYTGLVAIPGGCPRCGGEAGPHARGCFAIDWLLGKE